jgi:hypothetical protein
VLDGTEVKELAYVRYDPEQEETLWGMLKIWSATSGAIRRIEEIMEQAASSGGLGLLGKSSLDLQWDFIRTNLSALLMDVAGYCPPDELRLVLATLRSYVHQKWNDAKLERDALARAALDRADSVHSSFWETYVAADQNADVVRDDRFRLYPYVGSTTLEPVPPPPRGMPSLEKAYIQTRDGFARQYVECSVYDDDDDDKMGLYSEECTPGLESEDGPTMLFASIARVKRLVAAASRIRSCPVGMAVIPEDAGLSGYNERCIWAAQAIVAFEMDGHVIPSVGMMLEFTPAEFKAVREARQGRNQVLQEARAALLAKGEDATILPADEEIADDDDNDHLSVGEAVGAFLVSRLLRVYLRTACGDNHPVMCRYPCVLSGGEYPTYARITPDLAAEFVETHCVRILNRAVAESSVLSVKHSYTQMPEEGNVSSKYWDSACSAVRVLLQASSPSWIRPAIVVVQSMWRYYVPRYRRFSSGVPVRLAQQLARLILVVDSRLSSIPMLDHPINKLVSIRDSVVPDEELSTATFLDWIFLEARRVEAHLYALRWIHNPAAQDAPAPRLAQVKTGVVHTRVGLWGAMNTRALRWDMRPRLCVEFPSEGARTGWELDMDRRYSPVPVQPRPRAMRKTLVEEAKKHPEATAEWVLVQQQLDAYADRNECMQTNRERVDAERPPTPEPPPGEPPSYRRGARYAPMTRAERGEPAEGEAPDVTPTKPRLRVVPGSPGPQSLDRAGLAVMRTRISNALARKTGDTPHKKDAYMRMELERIANVILRSRPSDAMKQTRMYGAAGSALTDYPRDMYWRMLVAGYGPKAAKAWSEGMSYDDAVGLELVPKQVSPPPQSGVLMYGVVRADPRTEWDFSVRPETLQEQADLDRVLKTPPPYINPRRPFLHKKWSLLPSYTHLSPVRRQDRRDRRARQFSPSEMQFAQVPVVEQSSAPGPPGRRERDRRARQFSPSEMPQDLSSAPEVAQVSVVEQYRAPGPTPGGSSVPLVQREPESQRLARLAMEEHDQPDVSSKLCAYCDIPAKKRCVGCRRVRYCSEECQAAHWRDHKCV